MIATSILPMEYQAFQMPVGFVEVYDPCHGVVAFRFKPDGNLKDQITRLHAEYWTQIALHEGKKKVCL